MTATMASSLTAQGVRRGRQRGSPRRRPDRGIAVEIYRLLHPRPTVRGTAAPVRPPDLASVAVEQAVVYLAHPARFRRVEVAGLHHRGCRRRAIPASRARSPRSARRRRRCSCGRTPGHLGSSRKARSRSGREVDETAAPALRRVQHPAEPDAGYRVGGPAMKRTTREGGGGPPPAWRPADQDSGPTARPRRTTSPARGPQGGPTRCDDSGLPDGGIRDRRGDCRRFTRYGFSGRTRPKRLAASEVVAKHGLRRWRDGAPPLLYREPRARQP